MRLYTRLNYLIGDQSNVFGIFKDFSTVFFQENAKVVYVPHKSQKFWINRAFHKYICSQGFTELIKITRKTVGQ